MSQLNCKYYAVYIYSQMIEKIMDKCVWSHGAVLEPNPGGVMPTFVSVSALFPLHFFSFFPPILRGLSSVFPTRVCGWRPFFLFIPELGGFSAISILFSNMIKKASITNVWYLFQPNFSFGFSREIFWFNSRHFLFLFLFLSLFFGT